MKNNSMMTPRWFHRLIPLIVSATMATAPGAVAFPSAAVIAPAAAAAAAASFSSATASPFSNRRETAHRHCLQQPRQQREQRRTLLRSLRDGRSVSMALPSRPASVAIFVAGMVLGISISSPISANFRLYRTVPDIPPSLFKNHATLAGTVVSVSDGDSIRVRHRPNVPLPLPGRKMEGKRSDETLQIRLYAVDCPEVAHFGNPAQPFSAQAKEFTKDTLQGNAVTVKLLRMDQYNRAVCRVEYGRWPFRKDVSAELLKNGLGVLYRQGGAEYDGRESELADMESRAREKKEGLWSKAGGETPAQYKARIKRAQPVGAK